MIHIPQEDNKNIDIKDKEIKKDLLMREGDSEFQESGMPSRNLESDDPITIFRSLAHLTPNPAQRQLLRTRVTDLPLWHQSVEHWLFHGWNPKNLAGMLELYQRGGVSGCQFCNKGPRIHREFKTPHQQTQDAIESLRKKQALPPHQG